MTKSLKRTITAGALATGLVLGGVGIVAATTAAAAAPGAAPSSSPAETDSNDSQLVGSISAPAEGATEDSAAEAAALSSLASTTPAQAAAAAIAAVPGTAATAQLENADGYVVYQVTVTAADGTVTDVKVDAGNGSVLAQEAGDANETGGAGETAGETGGETGGASETGESATN